MGCQQIHFDVPIIDGNSLSEETQRVIVYKPTMVHLFNEDPCTAPLQICVKRVVKCQEGCIFKEFLHDIAIDGKDPILPPGEYELSVPQTFVPLFGGMGVSVDVVLEEVSTEFVEIMKYNKQGGC